MTRYIKHFLPYCGERTKKIDSIVLHCSAHHAQDMIKVLEEKKLSAHYIIDTDGKIYQLVPEKLRAWHAGESYWRGKNNLNHSSIGIELCSLSMGQEVYNDNQIRQTIKLCRKIMRHYHIKKVNIVAHSDIAPTRKPDPGKTFPWEYLAQKGIGYWYDLADSVKIDENNVEILFSKIGYDTSNLAATSYAFCRHFVPQTIDIQGNIAQLISQVYPENFQLPASFLPILKACAYKYGENKKSRA